MSDKNRMSVIPKHRPVLNPRTNPWGYETPRQAVYDLRGPLRTVPTGYLIQVLRKSTANATIMRRVALEVSKRGDTNTPGIQHYVRRVLIGRCDKCEKKALYIHGNKLACGDHKAWLTNVRARQMAPVNAALEEQGKEFLRNEQQALRRRAFHDSTKR